MFTNNASLLRKTNQSNGGTTDCSGRLEMPSLGGDNHFDMPETFLGAWHVKLRFIGTLQRAALLLVNSLKLRLRVRHVVSK